MEKKEEKVKGDNTEKEICSLLKKYAGKECRPLQNIEQIKGELISDNLNKDEYLITFKGILHQGESDRGVYDVSVSLFALIISFLAFFQNLSPIWWILPLIAVILSFVAIFYWTCNQRKTQYFAEMYEVISGLEKEGFFKKDGEKEEKGVTK